jgi:hypothetical protein
MTREEAQAWQKRWELVNKAEREELRRTPMEQKLRQLAAMMAAARELGWTEKMAEEEGEVRERWMRLRRVLGG